MSRISIAEEFTDSPGTRFRVDGEFSGEQFREEVLMPKLNALQPYEILEINFDGVFGYPPSFLEEAFGGLIREIDDPENIEKKLKFISHEQPDVINKVKKYISDALSNR
ncbi:MAG: STAS-like domain-containing protein [Planctomycetota bacterium]|jgi:hypothetical protein